MFSFERRWAGIILATFAPVEGPGLAPLPEDEVDYLGAYELFRTRSTWVASLGLRGALWLVTLSPWWCRRSFLLFPSLPQQVRIELLSRLLDHPVFLIREATFLLKLSACLALLGSGTVRARSGYDGRKEDALSAETPLVKLRRS